MGSAGALVTSGKCSFLTAGPTPASAPLSLSFQGEWVSGGGGAEGRGKCLSSAQKFLIHEWNQCRRSPARIVKRPCSILNRTNGFRPGEIWVRIPETNISQSKLPHRHVGIKGKVAS